jgi:hypothetical protein
MKRTPTFVTALLFAPLISVYWKAPKGWSPLTPDVQSTQSMARHGPNPAFVSYLHTHEFIPDPAAAMP